MSVYQRVDIMIHTYNVFTYEIYIYITEYDTSLISHAQENHIKHDKSNNNDK
jgi:hypothetical protein